MPLVKVNDINKQTAMQVAGISISFFLSFSVYPLHSFSDKGSHNLSLPNPLFTLSHSLSFCLFLSVYLSSFLSS